MNEHTELPEYVSSFSKLAGLLALLCSQRYTANVLVVFFLVWLFWLPYSAYVLLRRPAM